MVFDHTQERHDAEKLQISELAVAKLRSKDLEMWKLFGHTQRHVCFQNRKMVVYESQGTTTNKNMRQPKVLAVATVTEIRADIYNGIFVTLTDSQGFFQPCEIGPVPTKLFGLDVFMWVSHHCDLKFNLREVDGSRFTSEVTFAMVSKMRSAHKWNNKGNVYLSDLNKFKSDFSMFDYSAL